MELTSTIAMIEKLEDIFELQELQPRSYNQVFIGQPYSRILIGMYLHVINVKRQVISLASMKCQ